MYNSWRQHPTKQQLYDHLPPKTIKIRRTRHARHCWRSRAEFIRDVLLWTPSHGWAKAGRPTRTYIQQLCTDTRCSPEDLLEAMDDWEGWRNRVRNIRADCVMMMMMMIGEDHLSSPTLTPKVGAQMFITLKLVWLKATHVDHLSSSTVILSVGR